MSDQPVRGGRLRVGFAAEAARLNASHTFDRRLAAFDVAQSAAHVRMLGARGFVTGPECERVLAALEQVGRDMDQGQMPWRDELEDVHMHVEARLGELVGEVGGKLQTGRSRNDQVATDLRLYVRDAAGRLGRAIQRQRHALLVQARATVDVLVPGYTHLQRAQPIRLAHHLMAHVEALGRDVTRLRHAAAACDASPLGSGALAATSLPIDREQPARELGFSRVTRNSLDAVADRDFVCDVVYACVMAALHLSRLGEEWVLWSSSEFGFVKLPEAYCSGSSLMPQKMNPDVAELARARVGRAVGDLVALCTVLKGLPLAYNKDLQETQEPLYDAVESLEATLVAMTGLCAGLQFDHERLRAAVADRSLCATDLAEAWVKKGMPFREAHREVGRLAREGDLREAPEALEAVETRDVVGGPARARVLEEIARVEAELKD